MQNWILRCIYNTRFFVFLGRFCNVGFKSHILGIFYSTWGIKNAEFDADFESLKSAKIVQEKKLKNGVWLLSQYSKAAYNFCWVTFLKIFQRIRIQQRILRFFKPRVEFSNKNLFWPIWALFENFQAKIARNCLKKNEKRQL